MAIEHLVFCGVGNMKIGQIISGVKFSLLMNRASVSVQIPEDCAYGDNQVQQKDCDMYRKFINFKEVQSWYGEE